MTATRRQAREWAVQLLTSAEINPPEDRIEFKYAFWRQIRSLDPEDGGSGGEDVRGKLRTFAEERFDGVLDQLDDLDAKLSEHLDGWEMSRLGTVERSVLRLGAWELINTDIPTPVILNEAIDLANWYSTPKSRFLINSVLDKFARTLEPERSERTAESAKKRSSAREAQKSSQMSAPSGK